jgi:hypothetical protein
MTSSPPSSHFYGYRRGSSWLGRLGRSNLFAWSLSLGLHAAVFAVLYLVVFHEAAEAHRTIIPEARLSAAAQSAPPRQALTLELPRTVSRTWQMPEPPSLDAMPVTPVTFDEPMAAMQPTRLSSTESATLTSPPPVGSDAPVSTFFGEAGNAHEVVYVVDVSNSIMSSYRDEIVGEMRRAIRDLVPSQRFHIILAAPNQVEAMAPGRLVPAISQYKDNAMAYLDRMAEIWQTGEANPVDSLRRALDLKPELIYFLSDGAYSEAFQTSLLKMLTTHPNRRAVKITVLGFDPLPGNPHGSNGLLGPQALLQRIAELYDGHYRVVESR